MIKGYIKTKDVLLHPLLITHEFGLKKTMQIFIKAMSWKAYNFLPLVMSLEEKEAVKNKPE